jgi:serine/threonine protein kinase
LKNVDSPTRRARFEREIEVVQSINHPNILKVIDSDLTAARPYFVSEFCEGGSLLDVGASKFRANVTATIVTLLPLVDALVAVHNVGPIHRDIKPANILIRGDGTPIIADFGICFTEDGKQITLSDEGVGSKNFIAPEMESGQHDLGGPSDRTDVYCLGKVMFWMVSGGLEFSREDHRKRSLMSLLSDQRFEHVHHLLDEMVVREPQKRIPSRELRRRLEMTASLVEGNYAPLSPSVGIRCRFCGIGQYTPLRNKPGYRIPEIGLDLAAGTDARVLWCRHCGHVELFQFNGIENRGWWEK